ncbi:TetR/AcrR family transcriptional regulator [Rathayibacter sp. KR2-224]|uniref:TetR/AcrR family transcriptional regulator n=1 Tax=Rathayibacter sp. KR2-224 TaxID=3400913 RepID=UPI003C0608B9
MARDPSRSRAARKPPAEREAEIARAAVDLALEQGLRAVTLRGVAARTGVAPALVGHYVPSMDDLVARTFATIVRAELDEVTTLASAGRTPTERLVLLLTTALDSRRSDVTVVWVEAWAAGRRNEPLASAVRAEMDAWHSVVRSIVDDGVASAEFHASDTAAVSWQLLGMIDGLNAQALVHWGAASERTPLALRAVAGMLGLRPEDLVSKIR